MWVVVNRLAGSGVFSTVAFTSWVCANIFLGLLTLILTFSVQLLQRRKCRERYNCSALSPSTQQLDSSILDWSLSSNSK